MGRVDTGTNSGGLASNTSDGDREIDWHVRWVEQPRRFVGQCGLHPK
jgi:hypothetical protein